MSVNKSFDEDTSYAASKEAMAMASQQQNVASAYEGNRASAYEGNRGSLNRAASYEGNVANSSRAPDDTPNEYSKSKTLASSLYDYISDRKGTAWILTTSRRMDSSYPYKNDIEDYEEVLNYKDSLVFNVNPNSYQMDNPFRQTVVETKGGPVIHNVIDETRGNTNFGYPTINIEMSSGSLMPHPTYSGKVAETEQEWKMPPSVGNFYKFLEIVQEDTLYYKGNEVETNYHIIKMSTMLFPSLTLKGFFIAGANWSEQADNPNEVQNWQVQFKIYETIPPLTYNDIYQLYTTWK